MCLVKLHHRFHVAHIEQNSGRWHAKSFLPERYLRQPPLLTACTGFDHAAAAGSMPKMAKPRGG
jgi:hypothetical protein